MPSTPSEQGLLAILRGAWSDGLRPDPDQTVSEWADENRVLGRVSAGEPGLWRTSRTPYLREIMDAMSPSSQFERVVFMKGAQLGGTEALLNMVGYIIHRAPGPAILVEPTLDLGERFSKQRLASMISSAPALRTRVSDPRSRDSGNSISSKEFPGGVLIITGANSAVGLRSMPARYVLLDEVDGYPATAGGASAEVTEGDPADLAIARSETFANRKIAMVSTPTVEGISRIDQAYRESDRRKYYVPCPHCGTFQVLRWAQVKWEDHSPATAHYECEHCHARLGDHHKQEMLARGEWRSDVPSDGITAGFWLSALYSPWMSWSKMARMFIRARKSPERMQTFVNTVLAETYSLPGASRTAASDLMARREPYNAGEELPAGVVIVTAGCDVQGDRIEVELVGWGRDEESWSLAYVVLTGDPAQPGVWEQLDQVLSASFSHPSGRELVVAVSCVDAGYRQPIVQQWCADRSARRVFAIKGKEGQRPVWPREQTKTKGRNKNTSLPLHIVGSDTAKESIYARLKVTEPGPSYCHFPNTDQYDTGYFEQLTSETCRVRYSKGFAHREWTKKPGDRNEALDARVYAYAALHAWIGAGFRLNKLADDFDDAMGAATRAA